MITTTTLGGQRVSICMCTRTGRHLATFTRRRGSCPYTLTTEPPHVAASAQVSVSGPIAAPCLCRLVSHQTLLWHRRLGYPSLPCLRGMHSRLLVFCLPRSLPPLPPSPAPPCLPCVEGRQRAAPHSSSFPPTTAPLQTLHMDVWGPARVSGQDRERYFLLVVNEYTRYTTVFPLYSKGEVPDVLIPLVRAVRLQLRERFREDLPVLRLHSDRGGEFSSDLLREFCHGEGIFQSFTLSASPQQNGVAECRIGLVMEVARTSMIHATAPHFLWPFAVRYVAHQLNLWPRVSLPETSPTLRWTGKDGDATVFRVWGSRAFVRDTSADKLSSRAIPRVFLGFPPDATGWQFYHPTSRRVLPSQDVTFDESVTLYHLFPYRTTPLPHPTALPRSRSPSGGAEPGGAERASAEPGGAEPEGVEPGGGESEGAESGGAEPAGAEPWGTEPVGAELGGAESEGAESGGAEPRGTASVEGPAGASPQLSHRWEPLSPQQLCEWFAQRTRVRSGAAGAGGSSAGGTGVGGAGATSPRGGEVTAGASSPSGGGTVQRRPFFVLPSPSFLPPPELVLREPHSPLPAPSPYTEQSDSLIELREPESRPASPVCTIRTSRRVPRLRPPPVLGTHIMPRRPSSVPLRVPLPSPPASSLPDIHHPESNLARAAGHSVPRLLATVVTDPSFETTAASALVAELVDFAAACRLDYATSLVAESESGCPPPVGGECAVDTDVLEDSQEDFECLAAAVLL
ncbi:unnamed protein product [Closterium sp. NIES-54]